ncbi:MAG: hypothetical protein AAF624_08225 [Bacteroidota bacterium]
MRLALLPYGLCLLIVGPGCYTVLPEHEPLPLPPPTYAYATSDSSDVPFRGLIPPYPFAPSVDPATLVLRSPADIRALPPGPPSVSRWPHPSGFERVRFGEEMVLVVTLGNANDDTRIRVDSVLTEPDQLLVYTSVEAACYTRQVQGFPTHAIALPADPRPVRFTDPIELDCYLPPDTRPTRSGNGVD